MVLLIFCWLVMGLLCAVVAAAKRRSGLGWFILGCLFGPLALLFAAAMSSAPRNESAGALKICPHCAEKVKLQASLCKYCGQPLEVHSREVKNDWEQELNRLDK